MFVFDHIDTKKNIRAALSLSQLSEDILGNISETAPEHLMFVQK